MEQNIGLEPLGNGIDIYVSENHRFGTDAVILAHFAAPKSGDKVCDLCTGCGIIPMLWLRENKFESVVGVELQRDGAELFKASIKYNKSCKIESLCADLRDVEGILPKAVFDLVSCNPPYKASGKGILSETMADKLIRHETECTLADVTVAASKLLRFGGRLCICQRPERLADIFSNMRANKIEPKQMRLVAQSKGKEPWLVLVEGKLGAKAGLRIMPTLFVMDNGELTDEMISIYGDYKNKKGRLG